MGKGGRQKVKVFAVLYALSEWLVSIFASTLSEVPTFKSTLSPSRYKNLIAVYIQWNALNKFFDAWKSVVKLDF